MIIRVRKTVLMASMLLSTAAGFLEVSYTTVFEHGEMKIDV
jgi:hypothetical protein